MNSGIYRIQCPDGHYYIGSTNNFIRRKQEHMKKLMRNKHSNIHMQNRFNKSTEGWTIELIQTVDPDKILLTQAEQIYLTECVGKDKLCMNINSSAERPSREGIKIPHTEQTKLKISLAHKGLKCTAETKLKMSVAHKGKTKTLEHRQNLSKSCTGRKLTDETKHKKSIALKGKPWSLARKLAYNNQKNNILK